MGKNDYWRSGGATPQNKRKDSGSNMAVLVKDGSLEIVSEEDFRQRKNGIESVDPCQDCVKERGRDNKRSRKRKKKHVPVKSNSPIVVRLSDTIKVSVKGKLRRSPKSSDLESGCSTDSEDNNLENNNKENLGFTNNINTISKIDDLRSKAIKGNMRLKAEKNLNAFLTAIEKVHRKDGRSAFGKNNNYKSNLLHENEMIVSRESQHRSSQHHSHHHRQRHHQHHPHQQQTPPPCVTTMKANTPPPTWVTPVQPIHNHQYNHNHSSMLNNFRDYHYGNHNSSYLPSRNNNNNLAAVAPRGLKSIDNNPKNLKFVRNDLRGKGLLEKQDSEESESGSVISTASSSEYHSDIESGNSSSIESSISSQDDLSQEELHYLSRFTSGSPLTRYDCPPHECPECLAAYYSYTHYYSQGSDLFTFEVIDGGEKSSTNSSTTSPSSPSSVLTSRRKRNLSSQSSTTIGADRPDNGLDNGSKTYHVTLIREGQVEVSLANFHSSDEEDGDESESYNDDDDNENEMVQMQLQQEDRKFKGANDAYVKSTRREEAIYASNHKTSPRRHHMKNSFAVDTDSSNSSISYYDQYQEQSDYIHGNYYTSFSPSISNSSSEASSPSFASSEGNFHYFDTISIDLSSNSDVTFTVEYHSETDTSMGNKNSDDTGSSASSSSSNSSKNMKNKRFNRSGGGGGGNNSYRSVNSYGGNNPHLFHRSYDSSSMHQAGDIGGATTPTPAAGFNPGSSVFMPNGSSYSFLNNTHQQQQQQHSSNVYGGNTYLDSYTHEMFNYNFYSTMVGFFPYAMPPYYMAPPPPPYYYMCPLMMSIPRPLCVPRDLQCLNSQRLCLIPASEIKQFTASQPPQRPWIPIAHPEANKPVAIYTVMCYNVLCDKYCTRQLYGYCPSWALNWEYRKKAIIEEIRQYSADIISLQEVETEQFYNFFLPELKRDGYKGIFSPKSRAKTMSDLDKKHVDGCAIFFRATKFNLVKEHLVEFNQLAMSNAEGSHDMINRVMTKDNIGLAALLETTDAIWENGTPTTSKLPILVATCHIHWDPEFSDVKLIQNMMLMSELKKIVEDSQRSLRPGSSVPDTNSIPLLLCGDLNSLPDSGVVEYLTTGKVSANHEDFRGIGYSECLRNLNLAENSDLYTHGFKIKQAYEKNILPYTNYTYDFKGIIDYIFYSKDFMRPLGVLGPLDTDWFHDNKVIGCPHPHIPSDHLPLLVELEMTPNSRYDTTTSVAGGAGGISSNSTGGNTSSKNSTSNATSAMSSGRR